MTSGLPACTHGIYIRMNNSEALFWLKSNTQLQDTTIIKPVEVNPVTSKQVTLPEQKKDTIHVTNEVNKAFEIFQQTEQREKQIEHKQRQQVIARKNKNREEQIQQLKLHQDTIPYLAIDKQINTLRTNNFLDQIPGERYQTIELGVPVYREDNQQTTSTQQKHPVQIIPSVRHQQSGDWMLAIILGSFFLLAWVRIFFTRYLVQIINSLFIYHNATKLFRDNNILLQRISFVLNTIFILISGLFIYQLFIFFDIRVNIPPGFSMYLFCSGLIFGFIIFRYIAVYSVGFIFSKQREFTEYLHNVFLYNKSIGLVLLPVVTGIAFTPQSIRVPFVYTGLLIVVFFYILRIGRSFRIILRKDVLISYLILYLCILEILP
ncbi:MAG TPA: DUF4271 domain-containing protein, partial [Bacteroidales bacterium]|nr:DUF4271 domain-containing protein [Bacteroidales bacterium]